MELDDLKTAWREIERRLDDSQALNLRLSTELKRIETRSALRRVAGVSIYELVSGVVASLLTGSFLADHFGEARFAVPAVVLHLAALFTIFASVRQFVLLGRLDYSAPVVAVQRQLAALKAFRVRNTRWILLLSPLLWTPLAIVAAQGIFGFDLYREFGLAWIACNLALGVAVVPLAIWLTRRYSRQIGNSRWLKSLADNVGGRSLAAAIGSLDEVARFEERE